MLKQMKTVAIQGVRGAFHEVAAHTFFGKEINVVPFLAFDVLIEKVASNHVDYGIVAVRNSIAGTMKENLDLVERYPVNVLGKESLKIEQCLGALPDVEITNLQEVRSHYMALKQCVSFFKKHPQIQLVESYDTALSMKEVSDGDLKNIGCIGSKEAIKLYGLEVLKTNIQDEKENYTEFLIIESSLT